MYFKDIDAFEREITSEYFVRGHPFMTSTRIGRDQAQAQVTLEEGGGVSSMEKSSLTSSCLFVMRRN